MKQVLIIGTIIGVILGGCAYLYLSKVDNDIRNTPVSCKELAYMGEYPIARCRESNLKVETNAGEVETYNPQETRVNIQGE